MDIRSSGSRRSITQRLVIDTLPLIFLIRNFMLQSQNPQLTQLKNEIKLLRDEIGRLKRISTDFLELKKSFNKYIHIYTPSEFSTYLAEKPIINGEIVVENVFFESSMYGFDFPQTATKISFINSIAPSNMSRFFSNVVVEDEINLSGLDFSKVINMAKCFMGTKTKKLKITPISGAQGLVNIAYLCSHSEIEEIIIENLLNVSVINAVEAFSNSTISTFTLNGYSQLNPACSLAKAFANSKNLTSIDLSNLYGSVADLSYFIADCQNLSELLIPNLNSSFCNSIDNFAFNSPLLTHLSIHPSFSQDPPIPATTLKLRNRDASSTYPLATIKTATRSPSNSWVLELLH